MSTIQLHLSIYRLHQQSCFVLFRGYALVISSPVATFVQAWNSHRVPALNGGVLNTLATTTCQKSALPSSQVPAQAIDSHEVAGRWLSCECISRLQRFV